MVDLQNRSDRKRGRRPDAASTGCLFIVSAPSGAGKSTLCNAVRLQLKDLAYSVSYTTRAPRRGEKNGVDYHFISRQDFREGIVNGSWAEWAEVHGNYYGSSAVWIGQTLRQGTDILMDIDLQGARQMVRRFPRAVTIFILPPSMDELARRLTGRGTESPETIALRLANAREEIAQRGFCRHELVNDDLNRTTRELIALIESYRKGRSGRPRPDNA